MNGFELYNALVGLLSAVGFCYFLYVEERVAPEYRSFLVTMVSGLILFAVAPLISLLLPIAAHVLHGVAALLIIVSLYDPVHNDLRRDEWTVLLFRNPNDIRHTATWMVPLDDEVLELFHTTNLVLTPSIIAHNTDHSREAVNRRLTRLTEAALVERVERGKYRLTTLGDEYLEGRVDPDAQTGGGDAAGGCDVADADPVDA